MTDLAHSLNLTAGWYGNNCDCEDHCWADSCFAGDVNATLAFGFDSIVRTSTRALVVSNPLPGKKTREQPAHSIARPGRTLVPAQKLDGCGREEDVALWADMFNHSIRWSNHINGEHRPGMMIE